MATEEKLLKSFEYLRNSCSDFSIDTSQRNKEKIQHCLYIADTIISTTVKILPNFHQLLSTTFEVLFQLCNDNESDVRLKAEESLNKIIKAMDNENANKVLIELHKEIKKNGAARSLKAALWRFSNLADLIRLPKRKQYVINLIPCIINILERNEDVVHETLMNSFPKILKSLGNFLSDNDVKMLLNNFLKNISSSSTIIRRATVNCLLAVCMNCRKPYNFLLFLFNTLLDCLISAGTNSGSTFLILGVLNGLKLLVPYIKNTESIQEIQGSFGITKKKNEVEVEVSVDKFLQVYEICLHYLLCSNDSIVSASLDTLNSLLQNCTAEIKSILLSSDGIGYNRVDLLSNLCRSTLQYESPSTSSSLLLITDQFRSDVSTFKAVKEQIQNLECKSIGKNEDVDSELHESCSGINTSKTNRENINIGTFKDKEVSLIYCTRVICKSFLLTGSPNCTVSDTNIRISVKSLALTCLSSIFEMYPQSFLLYLDRNYSAENNSQGKDVNQPVSDILLLGSHPDPQLRGIVRIVVASFIKAVLRESNGCYMDWFSIIGVNDLKVFQLDMLLRFIMKGLQDDSSNCVRQTLTSLNICLRDILNSTNCNSAIGLLELLPSIVENSHWLVKAKLLNVIVDLPFLIIHSISGNDDFQNKIIFKTLFGLLEDDDQRVRTAAANAIVKIIPFVYFEQQKSIEAVAVERVNMYFYNLNLKDNESRHLSDTVPFPFNTLHGIEEVNIRVALSKIVSRLQKLLLTNATNSIILGYIETLSLLSLTYPSIIYQESWNLFKSYDLHYDKAVTAKNNSQMFASLSQCTTKISSSSDLLIVISSFLDSEIIYDINCHMHVLQVFGNLLAGICVQNWELTDLNVTTQRPLWSMFHDKPLQELCESFLNHIIKMLNIFMHIIDDIPLIEAKPISSNLSISGNASPLKGKKSNTEKNVENKTEEEEKHDKKNEPTKFSGIGHFTNSVHYMKIYDVLKALYANYKVTITSDGSDNILEFLNTLLASLTQILEIATIVESSRIAEEILSYLQTIFYLEPTSTVICVHQLLKSLFGTNLVLNMDIFTLPNRDENKQLNTDTCLHYRLSQYHYHDYYHYNNILKQKNTLIRNGDNVLMGYLHKKEKKHVLIKSDKVLASYIRLFEPMVIKSLKHYTITSNVELQCSVLYLLNQLVQLKVNYCLLDSEQVFIKFIQKQFEFIEEGLIAQPEKLIPKIFHFLMNLSHGKQHSKSIISVPKVIQLCDGLMASGQSPLTYCIPALKPIVEDLFVIRNKSNTADFSELEITREVLLSMLLRLFEYSEVTELLSIILNESKYCDNIEKWLKWSNQIFNILLTKLMHDKLKLDNGTNILSLMKLLISLNPAVFKSTNELLILLFQKIPLKIESSTTISRWFGKIIMILVIIVQLKEDTLLKNINESLKDFSPESIFDNIYIKSDPLNVTNAETYFEGLTPDIIFIKFIFRTLELVSFKCSSMLKDQEDCFLTEQLSHFLIIFIHLYESGNYCEIMNTTKRLIKGDSQADHKIQFDHLNENFLKISRCFPTITYQWCSLLSTLNYMSKGFWSNMIIKKRDVDDIGDNKLINGNSLYAHTSKSAAVIAFCEYLIENRSNIEELSWYTENNIDILIQLCEEPPIMDLISLIHGNSLTSSKFVEIVGSKCLTELQSSFIVKILYVLQNSHETQSGFLIQILVEHLLSCRHLAVLRMVVNLTCRKLEYLLTLKKDEIKTQMSEKQLLHIAKHIVDKKLIKKNETIVGLLNKLGMQVYNRNPLDQDQHKCIDAAYIRKLQINKDWYLNQLISKEYLYDKNSGTAKVFSQLGSKDIVNFCSSEQSRKLMARNIISYTDYIIRSKNEEILKLAVEFVFHDLINFLKMLPKSHQVYLPEARQYFALEEMYSQQLNDIFENKCIWQSFQELIPIVEGYAINFKQINCTETSATMNFSIIVKFAVLCLESIAFLLSNKRSINLDYIEKALSCANAIFKIPELIAVLALDVHLTWLCSSINSIHKLMSFLLLNYELRSRSKEEMFSELNDNQPKITTAKHACYQLASVFGTIEKNYLLISNIPNSFYNTIKSITIVLSKLPTVNSYVLTPTNVWKQNTLQYGGPFQTKIHSLPVDFLKDSDILEEFIFRVSRLGWSSRQQFEETWMSLLSVLNLNLIEEKESGHSTCFAIKALTALLAQTLYEPIPGNSNNSKYFHVPRDAAIPEAHNYVKKLKSIQHKFEKKMKKEADFLIDSDIIVNVFNKPNVEKRLDSYSCGQVSVAYLLFSSKTIAFVNDNSPLVEKYLKRQRVLEESGLDLNSCIQSLLDLYSQWINLQNTSSLKIFNEILKSVLIISDLFQQRSQFLWMLDTCIEISRNNLLENEIFCQYLTINICKAVAVLNPDIEVYEIIKKILSQNIRSPHLSMKISCLHGLLYMLEGCVLANTVIGGISEELQLLLPIVTEYIDFHSDTNITVLNQSQEHDLAVWALTFFSIENIPEEYLPPEFVASSINTVISVLRTKKQSAGVYSTLMKALERLVIKKCLPSYLLEQITKLALDKIKDSNAVQSLLSIQLLISTLYTECENKQEELGDTSSLQDNPDSLVQTIEKVSIIFDRIKKGLPFEVEILCYILPDIINDFFTPSDILTKIVGEFLSPQQKHPNLLSQVVFQAFESGIIQSQLTLLQDWVVVSLSNFTQSFSVGMATWYLNCFFISTSTNFWLRSIFPYVQSRIGRFEYEDKEILCIAARDFYNNLTTCKQRQIFIDTFQKVKNQTDMPFKDILESI